MPNENIAPEILIDRPAYMAQVLPFMGQPLAKVFTGLRRVGKSGLLALVRLHLIRKRKIPSAQIVWIDMEELDFSVLRDAAALQAYCMKSVADSEQPAVLLLDEAQEIPGWEKAVASLLKKGNWDIYLTGSNASMLSSDLASRLTGRFIEIPVLGLSYAEHLRFRAAFAPGRDARSTASDSRTKVNGAKPIPVEATLETFLEYLQWGGFPGIHRLPPEHRTRMQYLDALFNTVILRDVVERYEVRQVRLLESLANFLLDNVGQLSTAMGVSKHLKSQGMRISVDTVQEYIRHLEAAFAIRTAYRFDIKGKRYLESNAKRFAGDLALRTARLGWRAGDLPGLLENVVYLELLRRGYRVSVGEWAGREIDFVAERDGKRLYLQVCWKMESPATLEREFAPLELLSDSWPKLILSLDPEAPGRNGIEHRWLPRWLLEED